MPTFTVTYVYQGKQRTLTETAYSADSAKVQARKRVAAPIINVKEQSA